MSNGDLAEPGESDLIPPMLTPRELVITDAEIETVAEAMARAQAVIDAIVKRAKAANRDAREPVTVALIVDGREFARCVIDGIKF